MGVEYSVSAAVNHLCFSLTAEWEILAPSFGQVTGLGHINLWNTLSFDKYVFPVLSITLRSHKFVIISRCDGS